MSPKPDFSTDLGAISTDLGAIAFQNDGFAVRIKTVYEKEPKTHRLQIAVHRKDEQGNEIRPNGYLLGSNMLRAQAR